MSSTGQAKRGLVKPGMTNKEEELLQSEHYKKGLRVLSEGRKPGYKDDKEQSKSDDDCPGAFMGMDG